MRSKPSARKRTRSGSERRQIIAADDTLSCIRFTKEDPDHWYGVKFEPLLPELIKAIGE